MSQRICNKKLISLTCKSATHYIRNKMIQKVVCKIHLEYHLVLITHPSKAEPSSCSFKNISVHITWKWMYYLGF